MATDHTGRNEHQRAGRASPHRTGERVVDTSVPRERKAEPASGPPRDPLPNEYQDERSDVPGLEKKLR
jgi:hypothetical protein